MAKEPIPIQATFPTPVSSVTVALWGSTATPALLEAFDSEGNVVDRVVRSPSGKPDYRWAAEVARGDARGEERAHSSL